MTDRMLNEDIQRQVAEIFADLTNPVSILYFGSQTAQCEYCKETRTLLEEVSSLSDMIDFQVFDLDRDEEQAKKYRVDKVPGIVVAGKKGEEIVDYGIRYAGIPAGHEFTSLINDLLMVSSGDSGLSAETRSYLGELEKPVHLQVFVTPT